MRKTAQEMWRGEQDKADGLYKEIWGSLEKAGISMKEQKRIMDLVAEYGNAEISAESYAENGVEVEIG